MPQAITSLNHLRNILPKKLPDTLKNQKRLKCTLTWNNNISKSKHCKILSVDSMFQEIHGEND